ncbi:translation initiation factor IF-2-like [Onychomys torridus]|uniref:translation initiation factor IF-2-like n=1 Tax=Onychomys torridus TaxID=38674 RepID=UPI00167F6733|nr:translation initiation factor IF-2-like [Onychomys torridus]
MSKLGREGKDPAANGGVEQNGSETANPFASADFRFLLRKPGPSPASQPEPGSIKITDVRVRAGSSQRSGAPSERWRPRNPSLRFLFRLAGPSHPLCPTGAARGRPAGAPRPRGRRGGRAGGYCTFPRARPNRPDALWSGPTPLHAAPPPLPSGPQQLPRRRHRRHPGGGRRGLKAAATETAAEASALPVPGAPPSDGGRLAAGPRRITLATARDRAPQRHRAAGGGAASRLPDQREKTRKVCRSRTLRSTGRGGPHL